MCPLLLSPINNRIYVCLQLRDIWAAESSKQGGVGRIDVLSWLSRATLDIIGLAGALMLMWSRNQIGILVLRFQLQV